MKGIPWHNLALPCLEEGQKLTNMKGMPAMNSWVPRSGGGDDRVPALQRDL